MAKSGCPCGAGDKHSNAQSGKCDAMKKGKLKEWQQKVGKRI
jgi:hypothetical protein